jgi:hypothetical protein
VEMVNYFEGVLYAKLKSWMEDPKPSRSRRSGDSAGLSSGSGSKSSSANNSDDSSYYVNAYPARNSQLEPEPEPESESELE